MATRNGSDTQVNRISPFRPQKNARVRKFIEAPGGRRMGDRVAYVTNIELLAIEAGPAKHWREEQGFDEGAALRDGPGLRQVLDLARKNGIAICIKG